MPDGDSTAVLRLIRPADLSGATAQTAGMIRSAAISGDLVGARALWMGRTILPPGVCRDPATRDIVRLETAPGDYVWVPPNVHHREENPSADTEAVVVIARSTQEAIVVNVDSL